MNFSGEYILGDFFFFLDYRDIWKLLLYILREQRLGQYFNLWDFLWNRIIGDLCKSHPYSFLLFLYVLPHLEKDCQN